VALGFRARYTYARRPVEASFRYPRDHARRAAVCPCACARTHWIPNRDAARISVAHSPIDAPTRTICASVAAGDSSYFASRDARVLESEALDVRGLENSNSSMLGQATSKDDREELSPAKMRAPPCRECPVPIR
jgi:hypothetical protein